MATSSCLVNLSIVSDLCPMFFVSGALLFAAAGNFRSKISDLRQSQTTQISIGRVEI
jgi:hypothetical protein